MFCAGSTWISQVTIGDRLTTAIDNQISSYWGANTVPPLQISERIGLRTATQPWLFREKICYQGSSLVSTKSGYIARPRFLRAEVLEMTVIGKTFIYDRMTDETFSTQIRQSSRHPLERA